MQWWGATIVGCCESVHAELEQQAKQPIEEGSTSEAAQGDDRGHSVVIDYDPFGDEFPEKETCVITFTTHSKCA